MKQSIEKWTKQNPTSTAYKKLEGYGMFKQTTITSNFLKAAFHKFYVVYSSIVYSNYGLGLL